MNHYPCLINNLFNHSTQINCKSLLYIQKRTTILININHIVHVLLPKVIRPWCRVANIRKGILILEISSASWKTKLLCKKNYLLSQLKIKISPSLISIEIKINPELSNSIQDIKHRIIDHNWKPSQYLSEKSAVYIYRVIMYSEGSLKKSLEQLISAILNIVHSTHEDNKKM